jgi:hypothetical protein
MSRQDFEKALRDAIKQPMASILNNPHCLLPITPMALDVRMQGHVPREVRSLL